MAPRTYWSTERIAQLKRLRETMSTDAIAAQWGVSRNVIAGACHRYMPKENGAPRRKHIVSSQQIGRYQRQPPSRPVIAAPPREPRAKPTPAAKPKKTIQWSVLQNGFTRNAAPARALNAGIVQRPSEARVTLPRVSIQRRDDFSDADVRAGSADRAWTERSA